MVRVNLFGTVAVIRAALPHLQASRGTVVTVASTLGLKGVSDATAYCASKFAVRGFTHALAAELAGRVGVTLLIPGGMRTAFFDGRTEQYKPGPDADLDDPAEHRGRRADRVAAARRQRDPGNAGDGLRRELLAVTARTGGPTRRAPGTPGAQYPHRRRAVLVLRALGLGDALAAHPRAARDPAQLARRWLIAWPPTPAIGGWLRDTRRGRRGAADSGLRPLDWPPPACDRRRRAHRRRPARPRAR